MNIKFSLMFPNIGLRKTLNKPFLSKYGKKWKDGNDPSFNSNLSDLTKAQRGQVTFPGSYRRLQSSSTQSGSLSVAFCA